MNLAYDARLIFENPFEVQTASAQKETRVILANPDEMQTDAFHFARSLSGPLKVRTCYANAADGSDYVIFLGEKAPPSLGSSTPGKAHRGTALGGATSALLYDLSQGKQVQFICVEATPAFAARTDFCKKAFLTALQQRAHSLRKTKSSPASRVRLVASEFFTNSQWQQSQVLHECMLLCRLLVMLPPNLKVPSVYEARIQELVQAENQRANTALIQIKSFQKDELASLGCNLVLAVGAGSAETPRILKLTYLGSKHGNVGDLGGKATPSVAFVGKGITFDSGGLDIKASSGMRNMKKDMGGSASALASFLACARLRLPVDLTCYLSIAENMISGKSMRPGDVYTARNGLTVEIDNTDAEGRLVLADALALAAENKPDWIVSLATLTGAARVALGPMVDALFSTDSEKQSALLKHSVETGDWVWALPYVDDYEGMFDSVVADMANSGPGGFAGAITAALFLRKFVENVPYTHLDTFMWADKPNDLTPEAGGTAKCVRLIVAAMEELCSTKP